MVFRNKSLKCHMQMFQHSNVISSVINDFREVIGYFYGRKCSLEMQNLNVYINIY